MVDLKILRRTIEESKGAVVTRRWLEEVERDLTELQRLRSKRAQT
jgi:hypothetical protein